MVLIEVSFEKETGSLIYILNFKPSTLSIYIGTIGILNYLTNCAGIVVVNAFSLKKLDKIPSETL